MRYNKNMSNTPTTIDEYINPFPQEVKAILENIRQVVHKVAPDAVETISYQMPTFKYKGKPLVYFGGWKEHVAIYPTPSGTKAFEKELAPYKHSKGTIQFALDQPVPYDLIKKIVAFRVHEILGNGQ